MKGIKEFIWSEEDKYIFASILEDENVFLSGPTGVGKTLRVKLMNEAYNVVRGTEYPELPQVPFYRVPLRSSVDDTQIIGGIALVSEAGASETKFKEGILVKAMREGAWVLLDELDAARPEVLFVLHSVFENPRELLLIENESQLIVPHPEFRVIATGNTLGRGDLTGFYQGTRVLNEAFLDRFVFFNIDYPNGDAEINYLSKFVERSVASDIVSFASSIRKGHSDGDVPFTISVRRTEALAIKVRKWGLPAALKYCILTRLDPSDRIIASEYIQRVFNVVVV